MPSLSTTPGRVLLTALLAALPLLPAAAQHKPAARKAPVKTAPAAPPATIYDQYQVQIKPEYAEGQFALQQYLKGVRLPAEVKEGRVQGAVYVNFVVRPDGRLTDAFVMRGLSAATNAEALRLVQAMPPWRPARLNDQAVATRSALLVTFQKPAEAARPEVLTELSGLNERVVNEEVAPGKVYTYVEQMPEFPGGRGAMLTYIQTNLKYPPGARADGKVFVSFVVKEDGRVADAQLVKGIGAGYDEAALRVITNMPRWTPGKQNGRLVAVQYTLPVTFSAATQSGSSSPAEAPAAPPVAPDPVYTYAEQMPTVSGAAGANSIGAAVQKALVLPAAVREGRSEGAAYVNFVVRSDGSVTDAKVVRSLCPACDEAALAAVRALPTLAPGKQNGRAVSVQLTVPLTMFGPNHVFEGGQVSVSASFPGGGPALRQYLTDKLREPKVLKQENLRGAVEVRFVVLADGKIGATEVVRPLCRSCDEEALRLVRDMPRWTPARDAADQPVSVRQNVLIPMPATPLPQRGSTGQAPQRPAPMPTGLALLPLAPARAQN